MNALRALVSISHKIIEIFSIKKKNKENLSYQNINASCRALYTLIKTLHSFRDCLVLKKPLLIIPHSIFITHYLSLKIPQLPKPCTFGTLFSTSHHSKICTFCGTHYLSTMLGSQLPYPRVSSLSP